MQCRLQLYDIMTAQLRNFLCFPLCYTRDAGRKKGQGGRMTKGGTLTVAYFLSGGQKCQISKLFGDIIADFLRLILNKQKNHYLNFLEAVSLFAGLMENSRNLHQIPLIFCMIHLLY